MMQFVNIWLSRMPVQLQASCRFPVTWQDTLTPGLSVRMTKLALAILDATMACPRRRLQLEAQRVRRAPPSGLGTNRAALRFARVPQKRKGCGAHRQTD
jgi:hypothetical protein